MSKTGKDQVIEPDSRGEGFWVVEFGVWEETSLLAGQFKRSLLKWFRTTEGAQSEFPDAQIQDFSSKVIQEWAQPEMSKTPPSWFDPSYAGERWNEDY